MLTQRATVHMSWSAQEYAEALPPRPHGRNGPVEDDLEKKYPPAFEHPVPTLRNPHTVIDRDGRIIAWYLPGILTPARQVRTSGCLLLQFLINHASMPCGMQMLGSNPIFEEGQ